jgi:hypothetical protein
MNQVTCISQAVYGEALTYAKKYDLLEFDSAKKQLKIQGDNQGILWFPSYCFDLDGGEAATIRQIIICDAIEKPITHSIDVELELSDGQWRWCFFVTPECIAGCGDWLEGTQIIMWYGMPHMIILGDISEELIHKALREIEAQGRIIECTKLMEELASDDEELLAAQE